MAELDKQSQKAGGLWVRCCPGLEMEELRG